MVTGGKRHFFRQIALILLSDSRVSNLLLQTAISVGTLRLSVHKTQPFTRGSATVTEPSQAEVLEQRVLATWGLREPPFADLATDAFFFPSEQHVRALDFMRCILCSRTMVGVMTGDTGVGKSMLIRTLLAELDDRILVAHVQRADLEPRDFFNEILQQFGLLLGQDDRTDRRLLLEPLSDASSRHGPYLFC